MRLAFLGPRTGLVAEHEVYATLDPSHCLFDLAYILTQSAINITLVLGCTGNNQTLSRTRLLLSIRCLHRPLSPVHFHNTQPALSHPQTLRYPNDSLYQLMLLPSLATILVRTCRRRKAERIVLDHCLPSLLIHMRLRSITPYRPTSAPQKNDNERHTRNK